MTLCKLVRTEQTEHTEDTRPTELKKAELVTLMRTTKRRVEGMDLRHDHRERGAMAYVTPVRAGGIRAVPADLGRRARVTVPLDERQY